MGQVTITLNGRTYKMACDDGQENYLLGLVGQVDGHVESLKSSFGQIGDTQLLLMASIVISDELAEARRKVERLEQELHDLKGARDSAAETLDEAQASVARTLDAAAERVETLTRWVNTRLP